MQYKETLPMIRMILVVPEKPSVSPYADDAS